MKSLTQWYFAYGSNMSKKQMMKRTGSIPESHVARLEGYRFTFRKVRQTEEVYADILPAATKTVLGVAYNCTDYALEQLDIFEGVATGYYCRKTVNVLVEETSKLLPAIVYIGSLAFSDIESQPSQEYLDRILAGTNDHRIDPKYVQDLLALARPLTDGLD